MPSRVLACITRAVSGEGEGNSVARALRRLAEILFGIAGIRDERFDEEIGRGEGREKEGKKGWKRLLG